MPESIEAKKLRARYYSLYPEKKKKLQRQRYLVKTYARLRKHQLKKYGLTPQQYTDILTSQEGLCAVCREPPLVRTKRSGKIRYLHVDHCHKTNKVRGLLCQHCNQGIGLLKDSPTLLRLATTYLEKFG